MLSWAAVEVDADPLNRKGVAELVARRTRAVVETAVEETITRTGRALWARRRCARTPQHAQAGRRPDDLRPAEPR